MSKIIVGLFEGALIGLVFVMLIGLARDIRELKPVDDCRWLNPNSKRGAVIYNRFKNEIRIECILEEK